MHNSSIKEMTRFIDTYLKDKQNIYILDVGSYDVNGSYKNLFIKNTWMYRGLDVIKGPNVDIIALDMYNWNILNNSFDVVISGQAFEHIEYPWKVLEEIVRITKLGGLICIIVPSAGKDEHRYPIDCWRIFPDGMKALAKMVNNLEILECYRNKNLPFMDCVLIGKKI